MLCCPMGQKRLGQTLTCKICNTEFYRPRSYLKRWNNATCSRGCAAVLRLRGEETVCQHCGKAFYRMRRDMLKGFGKFCSNECDGAAKQVRVTVQCEHCGDTLRRTPFQMKRQKRHFCSTGCHNTWKQRFGNRRSANAFTVNQKRDWMGDSCARCGRTDELELDHILPRFAGGLSTKENSQTLCRKCNREKYWYEDLRRYDSQVSLK